MSHHGDKPFDAYDEETAQRMQEMFLNSSVGPTGGYPQGKLTKSDEGELAFAVGNRDGKVVLDFGSPVAWIGMDPAQALALASSLAAHASKARIIGNRSAETQHKVKALSDQIAGFMNKPKTD
jgi:hypothetical protein